MEFAIFLTPRRAGTKVGSVSRAVHSKNKEGLRAAPEFEFSKGPPFKHRLM